MVHYILKKPTSYILRLNVPQINLDVSYTNKTIYKAHNKFLGLFTDNTLSWKSHIEQALHRLSAACYELRSLKSTYLTPL
jgi:hypothetical protein